ncbi:MAG: hypothetical protein AAF806_16560, partial [Bacteroidota bacterium]
ARVEWYENLIDKVNQSDKSKVIISSDDIPLDTMWQTWASSQEIWLLSTINTPSKPSSMMISHKPNKFAWAQGKSDVFFTEWEVFKYKDLPAAYFNFSDTSRYEVVKVEDL